MAEVESNKVYVRIEPSEYLQCKKDILESNINLIKMLIISRRFKELRREEAVEVRRAKRVTKSFSDHTDRIIEMLPKEVKEGEDEQWKRKMKKFGKVRDKSDEKIEGKKESISKRVSSVGLTKEDKYQRELEEIREKLARLG